MVQGFSRLLATAHLSESKALERERERRGVSASYREECCSLRDHNGVICEKKIIRKQGLLLYRSAVGQAQAKEAAPTPRSANKLCGGIHLCRTYFTGAFTCTYAYSTSKCACVCACSPDSRLAASPPTSTCVSARKRGREQACYSTWCQPEGISVCTSSLATVLD